MQRFPVTNREYVAFLDDLVVQGREEEALLHVPREKASQAGKQGAMIYGRNNTGRFILTSDADGDVWLLDHPVCMINWYGAKAYAAWQSSRDGNGWRLTREQEFEKAARGADGRFYPWGDHVDASWCCMKDSHKSAPLPSVIESYPVDASVYGIRGLGGNIREWCEDIYTPNAPGDPVVGSVSTLVQTPTSNHRDPGDRIPRVNRGGTWASTVINSRAATRHGNVPSARYANYGVRLSRSYARRQIEAGRSA